MADNVITEAQLLNMVIDAHNKSTDRCLVVAISGVKNAGKSTIALDLVDQLQSSSINAIHITADRWFAPDISFTEDDAGEVFYKDAIRYEELFELVIEPLKNAGKVDVAVELLLENTNEPYLHTYAFENVKIVVLDGIFLFKKDYLKRYDLAVWIECPMETARRRAALSGKEGLTEEETEYLYQTVYEPAMTIHMESDLPREGAIAILDNSQ